MSGHGSNIFLFKCLWFLVVLALCSLTLAHGKKTPRSQPQAPRLPPRLPVRAVSLGGWLVTEGWILPSLFDGIANEDLLDGAGLQFRSVARAANLTAEWGGGAAVVAASRVVNASWATFKLWRIDETTFNFRVFKKQFVGVRGDGAVVATAAVPGPAETFRIVRSAADKNRVRIRASNGRFLQVKRDYTVTADYGEGTSWSDDDPSVFAMSSVGEPHGEYQICNGYGTTKATPVMRVKYKLGVIIDLHAAPGSQNGAEHSASRDGSVDWGTTDATIAQTVQVIDFLASRYARSPSLLAVGLMNEPLAPDVSLDSLLKYYKAGYAAVRKHSSKAYVVMSSRLSGDSDELLQFAGGLPGAVVDVHYYLFNSSFNNMTTQQNIDYIQKNYAADLRGLTRRNGPLSFVGEWVAVWNVPNATKQEYQRLAQVQTEVYGQATFGWAYWTLKNVNNNWSLEWMIKNGYISLKH
ncbi:hypothetical protein ACP70R_045890 [Stipagrostis hirtigluma subsp. patula]